LANTGLLALCSKLPPRLPSDPGVTANALAYGLSSRWLGDRVSFNPSAQQTCWANYKWRGNAPPIFVSGNAEPNIDRLTKNANIS
jgi:hypothetical protein